MEWTYRPLANPAHYYCEPHGVEDVDNDVDDDGKGACGGSIPDDTDEFGRVLGRVLLKYATDLPPGTCFTFPLGGLRIFHTLSRLAGPVAMLVADKGHTRSRQLAERKGDPIVSLHGSLSMMVNFHAVGAFVREINPTDATVAMTPHQSGALDVALFGLGGDGIQTAVGAFQDAFSAFGTCDLFAVRDHCEDVAAAGGSVQTPLEVAVLVAHLSAWDCDVMEQFRDDILAALSAPRGLWAPSAERAAACLSKHFAELESSHSPRFDPGGKQLESLAAIRVALRSALHI